MLPEGGLYSAPAPVLHPLICFYTKLISAGYLNMALVWGCASSSALFLLDRIQRKTVRLITILLGFKLAVTCSSLSGYLTVSFLSLSLWFPFFRTRFDGSTSHDFSAFSYSSGQSNLQIVIPRCQISLFLSSLLPLTANPWYGLSLSVSPTIYHLNVLKSGSTSWILLDCSLLIPILTV